MTFSNRTINIISIALIHCITLLFIFKYANRIVHSQVVSFAIGLVYCVVVVLLLLAIDKRTFSGDIQTKKKRYLLFALIVALLLIAVVHIVPESSQVSRLPAIKGWLADLFNGIYPYNSQLRPSGFPFLFILAIPFYAIHNLGYIEVLGFVLFVFVIYKFSGSVKDMVIRTCILLTLPMFFYEIMVRSELFFNMALVVFVIFFTKKYVQKNKVDLAFVLTAVAYGLILSTRLVVGVVLAITLLHLFSKNLKMLLLFSLICGVSFIATCVPFYMWSSPRFIIYGPFTVQSVYLPKIAIIFLPLLILYFHTYFNSLREILFYNGIALFALVLISFLVRISESGLYMSIFGQSCFDISYFIFPVPFLILSITSPIFSQKPEQD